MISPTNTRLSAVVTRTLADRVADFARERKWSISVAVATLIEAGLGTLAAREVGDAR